MNKKSKLAENSLKLARQELENFQAKFFLNFFQWALCESMFLINPIFLNFQKEKQKKINDLDIVVIMRLSQLQFLNNGHLPNDLSSALVIDSNKLDRLQNRIKELQVEKASEKKLFK